MSPGARCGTSWCSATRAASDACTPCARPGAALTPYVDAERYEQVDAFLAIQEREAQWWRDASIAYFQSVSRRPVPAGLAPPPHPLEHYQSLTFPYAPGAPGRTAAPFRN